MAPLLSLQLLEKLLTGEQLSAVELDELITRRVKEDQYIDYKHGDILNNSDASKVLREYLSAFANSAGGILIVGMKDSSNIPTEVTGCTGRISGRLDDWATRCLTPISSYFAPLPRIQVVHHPNGDVLICAVQRSLALVPITESGGIIYHFRLHDQTLKAPDYFMADLLLGRRQQPIFEIEEFRAVSFHRVPYENINSLDLMFDISFRAENASIVWADDPKWGIIFYTHEDNIVPSGFGLESGKPGQHLLSYLEVKSETFAHPKPKFLVHYRRAVSISQPFGVDDKQNCRIHLPLRVQSTRFTYTWKAALYLIARNSPPIWYQIEFSVYMDRVKLVDENQTLTSPDDNFSIRKLLAERPIVAWEENT